MKRYFRLYLYFLRFSFSKALEFRLDFTFRIFMDILFYSIQFLFFNIIYLHTPILGGWSIEEMRIFIASYIFIDALHMTLFANNCWWLPIYINRGDLDYYLTKPVSTLFFLSLREFAANSFVNLLIATTLLTSILWTFPGSLDFISLLVFVLLLLNGCFLYFLLHLIFLLSVFWTNSPRGFGDAFFAVSHSLERPDKIFFGPVRFVFVYILPFAIMASFPVRYLLGENRSSILLTIALVTCSFFTIVQIIWRKGLKSYSSASS